MSFFGKKFKRTHYHNIDELVKSSNKSDIIESFKTHAPTVCFTRLDETTFHMDLQYDTRRFGHTFLLDVEQDMERKDGSKIKITYKLEGSNVLHQIIKLPEGKTAYFRRVFGDDDCIMTIRLDGTEQTASIFYRIVH